MYVVDVAEYGIRMLELAKKNSWNFWAPDGATIQCFVDVKKLNDSIHLPSEFLAEYIFARINGRTEPWDTEHVIDDVQNHIFLS